MLFGICPCTSRIPKFWHTYVCIYDSVMVIVKPWQFEMIASKHQNHLSSENIENPLSFVSIKNSGKKAFILWLLYYIVLPFYTSETLENNKFSAVFRIFKKAAVGSNGLKKLCLKRMWTIMLTHYCLVLSIYAP